MGVPFLYYNLVKKYNFQKPHANMENLYFDYNSIIHKCCIGLTDEDLIINKCIEYTDKIIEKFTLKNIHIMIDGVAPLGKIKQQRERRYKSLIDKKIWDSNLISPGTDFMKKLSTTLKKHYEKNPNVYISDSEEVGEGEHKIMKIIKDKSYIYGLDADLILLSLLKKQEIVLLRDNKDCIEFLNITELRNCIYDTFNVFNNTSDKYRILHDFVFLSSIFGNDFLPCLKNISLEKNKNGIDILEKCYKQTIKIYGYIVENMSVNQNNLHHFFKNLSQYDNIKKHNIKFRDDIEKIDKNLVDIINKDYIEFDKPDYKTRYYNYYGISNIQLSCEDYIKTMIWVYEYYNCHFHQNWNWFYKHRASPLIEDLSRFEKHIFINFDKDKSFSVKEQLFYILPKDSLIKTLSGNDLKIFKNFSNSINFEKYFPSKFTLNIFGVCYIWNSEMIINEMDYNLYDFLF